MNGIGIGQLEREPSQMTTSLDSGWMMMPLTGMGEEAIVEGQGNGTRGTSFGCVFGIRVAVLVWHLGIQVLSSLENSEMEI